ncbi:MAG: hypothetical protein MK198_07530 [Gracilimonas sp.]|uniref:hypothetical protein n=1 Tax=Gracilimonas sp. TaxID=1974203 RepID=UPI003752C631|nr:hypothetical protein [Gracilimonas sp.]
MSNSVKYIISILLIAISLSLLTYDSWNFSTAIHGEDTLFEQSKTGIVDIPLPLNEIEIIKNSQKKIQPIILLRPTACATCLNNLEDFKNLLKEREEFNDGVILFMNYERNAINHFMITTELDFSYEIIDSLQIHRSLRAPVVQNILFLNPENERVFYNEPIPNFTTTLESKRALLTQVDSLWKEQKNSQEI